MAGGSCRKLSQLTEIMQRWFSPFQAAFPNKFTRPSGGSYGQGPKMGIWARRLRARPRVQAIFVYREAYLSLQEKGRSYSLTFREIRALELGGKEAPNGATPTHTAGNHPKLSAVVSFHAGLVANNGRSLASRFPGKLLEHLRYRATSESVGSSSKNRR